MREGLPYGEGFGKEGRILDPSVGCGRREQEQEHPFSLDRCAVSPRRPSLPWPFHSSGTCSRHHFSKVNTSGWGWGDVRAAEPAARSSRLGAVCSGRPADFPVLLTPGM